MHSFDVTECTLPVMTSSTPDLLAALRTRRSAAMAGLIFGLGFASTFLHISLRAHYVCAEHERITHDGEHARHAVDENQHDGDTKDDGAPEQSCRWLAWIHRTSTSSPLAQPDLTALAVSTQLPAAPVFETQTLAGRPVPIRHVSPIKSPPAV